MSQRLLNKTLFQQVASIIPGIAALLGVMALAWINANDQQNQQNQINELNDHQDSICQVVSLKHQIELTFQRMM